MRISRMQFPLCHRSRVQRVPVQTKSAVAGLADFRGDIVDAIYR